MSVLGGMVYDQNLSRGVRKKYLPDPNPTKVELAKGTKYTDILKMAKSLFFVEFDPTLDTLSLADSSGVPIQISLPEKWTLGSFYQNNGLQPSRYKLYVVIQVSKNVSILTCEHGAVYICWVPFQLHYSVKWNTTQWDGRWFGSPRTDKSCASFCQAWLVCLP